MRLFCLILAMGFTGWCNAQLNDSVKRLIKDGIALHDQEQYDAAIAKYDSAIAIDQDNYNAHYEKSLSYLFAKRYDDCVAESKYLLEKHSGNPSIKDVYSNYGSAVDDLDHPEEAIAIFEKGLKRFPDFYLLHYNKALTLGRQKKWEEAQPFFLNTLQYKPNHTGALYYISMLLEHENKVAAVMACICFLSIEPEGKRAAGTLKYLKELLSSFAKKGADGSSIISIDADDAGDKKKANNFSMVQMTLGLLGATSSKDSAGVKSEIEQLGKQVNLLATALLTGQKEGRGLFWTVYAPFIIAMQQKQLIGTFSHIASITSGDERNIQWINAHQERLVDFKNWMEEYDWKMK